MSATTTTNYKSERKIKLMSKESAGGGIGFFGILGLIFITLKLCGVINWSWIWVLAPLWIPAAITFTMSVLIAIILLIAAVVVMILDHLDKKK